MELGAEQTIGLVQGDLSGLIIFLASISVASWLVVLISVVLRFGATVRYRRKLKRRAMEDMHSS